VGVLLVRVCLVGSRSARSSASGASLARHRRACDPARVL